MNVLPLSSRNLIRISGKDSFNFLQGIITNDIFRLSRQSPVIYAGFLSAQGRVQYEGLIYDTGKFSAGNSGDLLVECDGIFSGDIINHFKRYKLRSKVKFESAGDFKVGWIPPASASQQIEFRPEDYLLIKEAESLVFEDPRSSNLGKRVLYRPDSLSFSEKSPSNAQNLYIYHRMRLGIGEGAKDFPVGSLLPQESNLDLLNGIDYRKGCYVGQELVIRTHHQGIVRKRVLPVNLIDGHGNPVNNFKADSMVDISALDDNLQPKSKRPAGKLISVSGSLGLAMIRLDHYQPGKAQFSLKDNDIQDIRLIVDESCLDIESHSGK